MRTGKRLAAALAAVAASGVMYAAFSLGDSTREAVSSDAPALSVNSSVFSGRALSRQLTPSLPAAVPPGWRLTFDPGFTGSRLNTAVWATCYLWFTPSAGCTNFGNSDEQEWYLPSQDQVSDGILHLAAQRLPTLGRDSKGAGREYSCRSGMITTYPSFHFRYGYIQVTARVPRAFGLWPAFWLVDVRQKWPPEIDILENYATDIGVYFHPAQGPRIGAHPKTADLAHGWHTFGLSWTASSLAWFIDGRKVMSADQDVPHDPMYFIADLADYQLPATGGCDGSLLIKSVKVWQP